MRVDLAAIYSLPPSDFEDLGVVRQSTGALFPLLRFKKPGRIPRDRYSFDHGVYHLPEGGEHFKMRFRAAGRVLTFTT